MSPVGVGDVLVGACGPAAIRVSGCSGDPEQDWRVVHHLARRLAQSGSLGFTGSIPTYASKYSRRSMSRTGSAASRRLRMC